MITRAPSPPELSRRRLWCQDADVFLAQQLRLSAAVPAPWRIELGGELLFDAAGLDLVTGAIRRYAGDARELHFRLQPSAPCWRDYYSLDHAATGVDLPLCAQRDAGSGSALLTLTLPTVRTPIAFPQGLRPAVDNETPLALLLPYHRDHDLLFANQILLFSQLRRALGRSPATWIRGLARRGGGSLQRRCALAYRWVHPSAEIHPSAVIEGSWIGARSRIGAGCVVRYSRIGANVQLHDGAKVEHSQVDDGCWLMHDLVLYRSLCEPEVFLIHGPYQFSCFQRASAAFACIMMDFRPDGRPIKVLCEDGPRPYHGPFLGAMLGETSKVLGGSALAPGIIVPDGGSIAARPEAVTTQRDVTQQEHVGLAEPSLPRAGEAAGCRTRAPA